MDDKILNFWHNPPCPAGLNSIATNPARFERLWR